MGLELTTDKYPPITSQTRYPLRHAASVKTALVTAIVICWLLLCRLTTLVPELVCMFVFYGSYVRHP